MSNRQWKFYVIVSPKDDNRDPALQEAYEIQSTNASRAGNKAKKAHAEANGGVPSDFVVLEAYRTNAPSAPAADEDE